MIVITLSGGLGNQLFQYAFGRSLMSKYDVKFLENCAPWGCRVKEFNTQVQTVSEPFGQCIDMRGILYNPEYLNIEDNTTVSCGWFQSEKYFRQIADALRKEIVPREPLSNSALKWADVMQSCNSVSVSIRRGDYVNIGAILNSQYYIKAHTTLVNKLSVPKFFVFTDDPDWARECFVFPDVFEVVPHTVIEGLYLQKLCKHAILSNSTYAWWGAWLNPDDTRQVIVPDPWFSEDSHLWKDIIPERWIKERI